MKYLFISKVLSTVTIVLFSLVTQADEVVVKIGSGTVNWSSGELFAEGYGVAPKSAPANKKRLLARRAAQIDAYRNLAEMLNGVRVTSETVVEELVAVSDVVKTKLNTLVKGAVFVEDHYQNEIATVTMKISLDGEFMQTVTPEIIKLPELVHKFRPSFSLAAYAQEFAKNLSQIPLFPTAMASPQSDNRLIKNQEQLDLAKALLHILNDAPNSQVIERLSQEITFYEETSVFSGLIVDASSVKEFELATIPRLRTGDGEVIFPKPQNLRDKLAAKRPVSYDFDVNDAVSNDRVAFTPLIVKASGVYGSRFSDLVIDNKAAKMIKNNTEIAEQLARAGVMIVVSP